MPPEKINNIGDAETEAWNVVSHLKSEGLSLLVDFGIRILIAAVIVVVGFWIARRIHRLNKRVMIRRNVDATLRPFISSSLNIVIRGLVLIIAFSTMGIEMTSIIALLGSVGIAIGLALQGSLSNFAGGILILTVKPIRVGDFIEAQGVSGTVEEINILSTTIITLDFKSVYLPNGPLAAGTIVNMTKKDVRRVDLTIRISYRESIDKARDIILDLAANLEYTLLEPAPPFIRVLQLGDSSVDLTVRIWAHKDNYWNVYFYMNEHIKKAFDNQGVTIPFPQRDVHLHQ